MESSTGRVIRGILWGTLFGAALILVFAPGPSSKKVRPRPGRRHLTESQLDEMIEETFPASDPPSY